MILKFLSFSVSRDLEKSVQNSAGNMGMIYHDITRMIYSAKAWSRKNLAKSLLTGMKGYLEEVGQQ